MYQRSDFWIKIKEVKSDGTWTYQTVWEKDQTKKLFTVRTNFTTGGNTEFINIELWSGRRKSSTGAFVTWFRKVLPI